MPSSEYQVNIIISTKDKTSGEAKKAASGLEQLQKAAKLVAAGFAAMKTAQAVVELIKLGAASQRQETALGNLAKAAGTSGDAIIKAIQVASDFTIDRMTAMQTANRAMIMEVAETPAQFERITKVAVALGRAMGLDAATAMERFTLAAGRQSVKIADDLGMIVDITAANERYADANDLVANKLTETQQGQAFLNEMLRMGELRMEALGDSTIDNATKMEQASAAWKDAKASIGGMLATLANASGILDAVSGWARDTAEGTRAIEEHGFSVEAWAKAVGTYMTTLDRTEAIQRYRDEVEKAASATVTITKETSFGFGPAITTLHGKVADINPEIDRYRNAIEESSEVSRYMHTVELPALAGQFGATDKATLEYLESLNETTDAGQDFVGGATGIIEVLQEERKAAASAAEAHADLAETLMDASAAQIASAAIRQLTQLMDDGKISAEDYALAVEETQLEFGLASEASINLSNRLVELVQRTGEGEVSAQDFKEELERLIAVNQTENAQLEQFGRILYENAGQLQNTSAAADGFRSSVDSAGSSAATTAAKTANLTNEMASLKSQAGAVGSALQGVIDKLKAMPSEKRIRIIYELSQPDVPGPGGGIPKQHGGPVKEGFPYIVGERGPELFVPGSAGQIINNTRATNILKQNTYQAGDMRVMPQSGAGRGVTIINHFGAGSVRSDRDIYRNMELQEKSLRLRGVGAIA